MISLDEIDLRIAHEIQRDGRRTVEDIGSRIGLSPSSVHRRLDRMRRDGAILEDAAVLNPPAFGMTMTFVVEVTLERVRAQEAITFKQRLRDASEIQQAYNVTGEADYLLIVLARDIAHFEEISRRVFSSDPMVRRYRTSVVMDRVKVGLAVPVQLPQSKRQKPARKPGRLRA